MKKYILKELLNPNIVVFINTPEEWQKLKATGLFNMTTKFFGSHCYHLLRGTYASRSSRTCARDYEKSVTIVEFNQINFNENMKNKIIIEGKEFDLPDELVNKIKEELREPKKVTYEEIAKNIMNYPKAIWGTSPSILCASTEQYNKLLAINKLMNVAKYLNGGWKADFEGPEAKHFIRIKHGIIEIEDYYYINESSTYFKTKELAQQAISILGEDTIRLALSTDW
jgi:hypothetical protein